MDYYFIDKIDSSNNKVIEAEDVSEAVRIVEFACYRKEEYELYKIIDKDLERIDTKN